MSAPIYAQLVDEVLKPLGTKLGNYMPVHRDAAVDAMRQIVEGTIQRTLKAVDKDSGQ